MLAQPGQCGGFEKMNSTAGKMNSFKIPFLKMSNPHLRVSKWSARELTPKKNE
ncbi:hypothetical protein SAMN04488053_11413 [Alkalicoccus daliensis]|uniref:Uncharacterized protein n=1 Tax=Alkalicoccus daliensis TaxID=745820 RepID=A0A1H0JMF6_9BACI|nr:hypothetical protein SAMN04488053_11413 [Alkalicoccus daliensis]